LNDSLDATLQKYIVKQRLFTFKYGKDNKKIKMGSLLMKHPLLNQSSTLADSIIADSRFFLRETTKFSQKYFSPKC